MRYKYVAMTRPPRSDIYYEGEGGTFIPQMIVYEAHDDPKETGLLDASGTKLYRVPQKEKIGF